MDATLIAELDEKIGGLQDDDRIELNTFEDSDFAMYPGVEIPEVSLDADQCEMLANYFVKLMHKGLEDDDSMAMASRGLAALAYNSFMDVDGDQKRPPFFHKYNNSVYTESWLRTSGVSDLDLQEMSNRSDFDSRYSLKLVNPAASEFERKAAIGVWAFVHLGTFRFRLWDYLENDIVSPWSRKIPSHYRFRSPYEFPLCSRETLEKYRGQHLFKESLYLFYRTIITLENIPRESPQSRCLVEFSGIHPKGPLTLYKHSTLAAEHLDVELDQLFDYMTRALEDKRWAKYSVCSLKIVKILKEYYNKYEAPLEEVSRYYKYPALVNLQYFYYLHERASQELCYALRILYQDSKCLEDHISDGRFKSIYKRWGRLLAENIIQQYQSNHPSRDISKLQKFIQSLTNGLWSRF